MKKYFKILIVIFICIMSINSFAQTNEPINKKDSSDIFLEGKILSKKGNTVIISYETGQKVPEVKQSGLLSLFFEETLFGIKTTGWLDIGEMKIISVKTTSISMTLNKELSIINKNGQKVDHFKPGKLVRFNWK